MDNSHTRLPYVELKRLRRKYWVHLFSFILFCGHIVRVSAEPRRPGSLHRHFSRIFSRSRLFASLPDGDKLLQELHQHAVQLQGSFFKKNLSLTASTTNIESCTQTTMPGLDAVKSFFPLLHFEEVQPRLLAAVFPFDSFVSPTSAYRGQPASFRLQAREHFSTLQDIEGRSFTVKAFFHEYASAVEQASVDFLASILDRELSLHELFKVDLLDTVECRYRLKTVKDILIFPDAGPCIPALGGCFLNSFWLYNKITTTLQDLVHAMAQHDGPSYAQKKRTKIARLNLSVQLLQLVARIIIKRIALPHISPVYVHVDGDGTLYIQPKYPVRREDWRNLDDPFGLNDSDAIATNIAALLLYVWCPKEAKPILRFFGHLGNERLQQAAARSSCTHIPAPVHALIADLLSQKMLLDEIYYEGQSFKDTLFLLRKELEVQEGTGKSPLT